MNKNSLFKVVSFVFVFIFGLLLFGCNGNNKDVEFEAELGQKLGIGEEAEIKISYEGKLDESKFSYSVDDESVLEIDGKRVKGLAEGLVTVSVTYGNVTKELIVNVCKVRIIEYNLDGGVSSEELQTKIYQGTSYTLPALTREGYIFQGWYSNPNFAG